MARKAERSMSNRQRSGGVFYGAYISLLMLYVLFVAAGIGFYSYQVFVPRIEEDFGWSRFQTVYPAALWAVVFGISGFFVGAWIQKYGVRKVLVTATIVGAGLNVTMSMITQHWHLLVVLGASAVTVAATTLVPAQTVITIWFNKRRGRFMGLTMMGIGVGGLVVPLLIAWLIQQVGWRSTYRISAFASLLLILPPVLLFLKSKPSDIGEIPDGRAGTTGHTEAELQPSGIPARRAVRTVTFWLLIFTYLTQIYVISAINVNMTVFAEGVGYPVLIAPLFMSIALGVSIPGRFVFGWLTDQVPPQRLMALAGLLLGGSTVAAHLLVLNLGLTSLVPIWVFGILEGLGVAANSVVLAILVGRCFGSLEFGQIQGLVMVGFAGGVVLGGPSAAWIFDVTGSYGPAFIVCGIMGVISAVLAMMIRPDAHRAEFVTADDASS